MTSYIQSYGFTKTLIQDNHRNLLNEIKWKGDYNGKVANIDIDINDNGNKEFFSTQLKNNELIHLFGIQPVKVTLEKRLMNDFLYHKSNTLEGDLIKRKTRRHRKKNNKRRKTKKSSY